ncbi:MAG: 50S ribosomal protein L32 [Candidatus Magasanikbacteria bacterium]
MGLPAKQRTRTSKRNRASHFALKKVGMVMCQKCKAKKKPHLACPTCGEYKGKKVVNLEKRILRTSRKPKA